MRLRTQIGFTAILAAGLAAGWLWFSGWGDQAQSSEPRRGRSGGTQVLVETLTLAEDRLVLRAVGTGRALKSASIHPTVSGKVVEVLFEAEQRIAKDTPLVHLDAKHARLAVRLAQVVEKEERRQVTRYERLSRSGTVSTVALEAARAKLDIASLRLLQAEENLRDHTIFAPFDGVIGLSEVDPGDRVTDDTPIAVMDDRSSILVEFTVPEKFAGRVAVGDRIAVRPWINSELGLQGTVSAVHSRIDRTTRSLRVQATIANADDSIRPGTSFEVELAFTGKHYPSVPEVAVLWSRDGVYIWRVTGARAEKVFVKMVRRNRGRVLVDGPLREGDVIVVEGVQGLRDGQKVEARPIKDDKPGAVSAAPVGGAA
jgi:RND family efflux transporter MFP subunit